MGLPEFLTARYAEDEKALRDPLYAPADERYVLLVRHWDHIECHRTIVAAFEGASDPTARRVLWSVLLVLAQPYEPHPDFDPAWTAALTDRLTERG